MKQDDGGDILGVVEWVTPLGVEARASLSGEGVWDCSIPELRRYLNASFVPESSPAGPFGLREIRKVAERFGGTVSLGLELALAAGGASRKKIGGREVRDG